MKKFLIIFLFPALYFSQFSAGRYMIKQAVTNFSIKAVDYPAQHTKLDQTCADYKVNCGNQIFDITEVKGFYTINVADQNLFLTFESKSDNSMRFYPKKPVKMMGKQLFSIVDSGNGTFYIKPKLNNNANYYIGTRMDLYPEYGSELQFLVKEIGYMPREYSDLKNVSWTFFAIPQSGVLYQPSLPIKKILPAKLITPQK